MPQTYIDVVDMLVPELRKRGIYWDDYCVPGGCYRENFHGMPGQKEPLPTHPAAKMIWRPSKAGEDLPNGVGGIRNGMDPMRRDANGPRVHFEDEVENGLDPMAMQIC